jgi:hypothetical protein
MNDDKLPIAMPLESLKPLARAVADDLQTAASQLPAASGGGSRQRGLPEELRERFINVRAALFQRGVYDPMLVRFDSATVTQAETREIGERLAAMIDSL